MKHGASSGSAAGAAGVGGTGTAMGSPSYAHGPGGVPNVQPSVLHNASWPSANSPTTMAQRRGAGGHDSGASGASSATRHRQARANSELPPVSSPLHPGLELPAKSHGAGPHRAHHAKNGQLVTMSSPLHTVTNEAAAPPVSPLLIGGQKPSRASSSPDFLTDYRSTGLRKPGRPSTTAKSPAMTIAASPLTMTRPSASHT